MIKTDKETMPTKPTLQRILGGILGFEEDIKHTQEGTKNNESKKSIIEYLKNKSTEVNTHYSIITLNIHGLNTPMKRHRKEIGSKNRIYLFCCIQETL